MSPKSNRTVAGHSSRVTVSACSSPALPLVSLLCEVIHHFGPLVLFALTSVFGKSFLLCAFGLALLQLGFRPRFSQQRHFLNLRTRAWRVAVFRVCAVFAAAKSRTWRRTFERKRRWEVLVAAVWIRTRSIVIIEAHRVKRAVAVALARNEVLDCKWVSGNAC
jgi:hypothetical protein